MRHIKIESDDLKYFTTHRLCSCSACTQIKEQLISKYGLDTVAYHFEKSGLY